MFRGCTMAPSLASSFHGQLSQALLNPQLKLLANVPELYYCPKPSEQLLWPALTANNTASYSPRMGLVWYPPIVQILKLQRLARDF
jgi:hypothetical protein